MNKITKQKEEELRALMHKYQNNIYIKEQLQITDWAGAGRGKFRDPSSNKSHFGLMPICTTGSNHADRNIKRG
jgi:hypothetical protein